MILRDKYQEMIGEILYLANRTRPNIAFVTYYLSQYNHCPREKHYKLCKRVLCYLHSVLQERVDRIKKKKKIV